MNAKLKKLKTMGGTNSDGKMRLRKGRVGSSLGMS